MLDKRKFYIDGEWVDPIKKNDFDVINPCNEDPCAVISLGSTEDTNRAVKAAKTAFETWKETSKEERIKLLEKLLTIYKKRFNEMAEAISLEMGAPMDWSTDVQTASGRDHLEDFILRLKNFNFEEHFDEKSNNHICYEPIGVCGLITPWNWPINQIALKVAPAFATGCTMILKPSEIAPISGMLFAEMIDEAGFPKGVFNLVNGDGAGVGTDISSHPDIDMVSFTGSTRAGRLISKNAAETIKRVCLELGGKGGNIVFADSYKDAVRDGIRNVMSNSGQSCDAPTRMLVEKSIYERAVKEAVDEANKIKVDQATKKGDHIGPVISKVQYDKIINLIESGISEGATLAAGGPELPNGLNKGYFIKPTIFTDVTNEMRIAKEEIFGPVLSIIPFDTEDEAVKIVNDTSYGLGNYLQTDDKEKAHRVAKKLRSGCVYINGNTADVGTPFGGYRQSGNGREGGVWGLTEFLEVKNVTGWKN
ncbi:aldehyde dehydrogenase family protein [Candidatus Pelagibacter sp.]|uniref:aldehyde dehydrogenase family protein n=1 Tax=Candidatus Pelagibacter sp. TaxID=2024849 RepID=UPI003F83FF93